MNFQQETQNVNTTLNTTSRQAIDARRQLATLQVKLEQAEAAISEAEQALGADFRAVADGAEINADAQHALTERLALKLSLQAMVRLSSAQVEIAERRVFARGILASAGRMEQLLAERDKLAKEAEGHLVEFGSLFDAIVANGRECVHRFTQLRGRNTLTGAGHVVAEIVGLSRPEHVGHLTALDLIRRGVRFHYEAVPPYHIPRFSEGITDASRALRSEFNSLMGIDTLTQKDIAAVRQDMSADGEGPVLVAGPADGETDIETLMLAAPDLYDGPFGS